MNLLTWQQARSDVVAINPSLSKIIDDLSPSDDHYLIKAQYSYGDSIIRHGDMTYSEQHPEKKVLQQLGYSSIPLSLVLKSSCEVFIDLDPRVIPLNIIEQGNLFGVFEVLDSNSCQMKRPIWSVTAGARTLFMLPKVSQSHQYRHLVNEFDVSEVMPHTFFDQWKVFKQIAHHEPSCDWQCELLLFGKKWFQHHHDPAWHTFNNFILQKGWHQTEYLRSEHSFCFLWQLLNEAITELRLKPSYYQFDTVKHLITMQLGGFPGFVPAKRSSSSAPISLIQDAYVNVYQLKDYLPILIHPGIIRNSEQPVYYSLGMPTLPEGGAAQSSRGKLKELKTIKLIMEQFFLAVKETSLPIPDCLRKIKYRYFHTNYDSDVHLSEDLPRFDRSFIELENVYQGRTFPTTGQFTRGCIQINPC